MSADRIAGTDDARVENSPMRHSYRVLSDAEKAQVTALKDKGDEGMNREASRLVTTARRLAREAGYDLSEVDHE